MCAFNYVFACCALIEIAITSSTMLSYMVSEPSSEWWTYSLQCPFQWRMAKVEVAIWTVKPGIRVGRKRRIPSQHFVVLLRGRCQRGCELSAEDRKKYQKVIEEFNNNFKVKKNIIYERAHFNQRSQFLGESVDCFITEIHRLVDNSEFGGMKDELICNRLVVGIWDSALSERLQLESELTLDEAKQLIQ